MNICCDLDDVLSDCTGDIMRHMGLSDWKRSDHFIQERNILKMYEAITGIDYKPEVFWEHFNRKFWAELARTTWCYDLIAIFERMVPKENILILTSPTKCGNSLSGKLDWIQSYMPDYLHRQFSITPRKHFNAIGSVLIDDCEENVDQFVAAGGNGILFPQPFNRHKHLIGLELQFVNSQLSSIL